MRSRHRTWGQGVWVSGASNWCSHFTVKKLRPGEFTGPGSCRAQVVKLGFEIRADPWLFPSMTGVSVPGNWEGQEETDRKARRGRGESKGSLGPPCPEGRESRCFLWRSAVSGWLPGGALHAHSRQPPTAGPTQRLCKCCAFKNVISPSAPSPQSPNNLNNLHIYCSMGTNSEPNERVCKCLCCKAFP